MTVFLLAFSPIIILENTAILCNYVL